MANATPMTRLEHWLTENDVTYEELAEKLGVSSPAIFHYVRGRNRPTAANLVKISEITGIPCNDLISSEVA